MDCECELKLFWIIPLYVIAAFVAFSSSVVPGGLLILAACTKNVSYISHGENPTFFLLSATTNVVSVLAAIWICVSYKWCKVGFMSRHWQYFFATLSMSCFMQVLVVALVPFLLGVLTYGVYILLKCCIERLKTRKTSANTTAIQVSVIRTSFSLPQPLRLPPVEFDRFSRKRAVFLAPEAVRRAVERLMMETWDEKVTGVGRDATGLTHYFIKVKNVYVIERKNLKTRYEAQYKTALQHMIETNNSTETIQDLLSVQTTQILSTIPDLPTGVFDLREGEVLLFHGTPRDKIKGILQHGFRAKNNWRSLYGKGTYLTDSAQKADQYTDQLGTRTNNYLTMFLVRVALGWTVKEQFSHLDCDTVVAGTGKLFQEFVAKKDNNLFPQLLIEYNRV